MILLRIESVKPNTFAPVANSAIILLKPDTLKKFRINRIDCWVSPKENYALFGSFPSELSGSSLSLPLSNFTTL